MSAWVLHTPPASREMVADEAAVRHALALFADPDHGCEVMALTSGAHRTLPGSDLDGLVRAVGSLPGGQGVYFRINPVPVGLGKPAVNGDVVSRRWVYIDVDPAKPEDEKDNPATGAEKAGAFELCEEVTEYLAGKGWPVPVVTDSGNGYGMFYRADLPNDAITRAHLQRLLKELSEKFTGERGVVDKSVHNANRLVKLPGTWARKGTNTPDRPHRVCRLFFEPATIGVLTADVLAETVGPDTPDTPRPSTNGTHSYTALPSTRTEAYARKAIDAECLRVVMARPGPTEGRNNALNRAAFSLGQLVAGGVLDRAEVEKRLFEAACSAGLDKDHDCGERGIRGTIQSGLSKGVESPRGVPEGKPEPRWTFGGLKPNGEPVPPSVTTDALTVNIAAVKPQRVEWLVKNRIARHYITVFAGRTSVGKSCVAIDLIARMSVGGEIPGGNGLCFEAAGTLVISEDPVESMIAPRLIAAGADLTRVNAMTWDAMGKYHLGDTALLERACAEVPGGASLVYIDPPTNFLEGVDEHKNSEVRQLVMRVVAWLAERDVACVFVLHVNKQVGKGIEALNRVMGSVAWVTTARVAHSFCIDPDEKGRCLWVPLKNNLGPLPKALAYRIVDADGVAPRVEWAGEVDTTADEAMGHAPRERRDVAASTWLVDRFRERLEWDSKDLFTEARAANVSRNAVFEAKKLLNLPGARKVVRENGDEVWVWWVPADWAPLSVPGTGTVGTVGTVE